MNSEEEYKNLTKESTISDYFDKWLNDFEIANPTGDYFLDPENYDEGLVCNIQTKIEFLLHTLVIFGLPKGYIDGEGQHLNWEEKARGAANAKKKKKNQRGATKQSAALKKLQE